MLNGQHLGRVLPLQEYGTTYFDGLVETWIPVPPISTPFSVSDMAYFSGHFGC